MATKTLTAPLAIIKVNGVPVGKMRNVRITETIRRGKVFGLGRLTPDELPALEWDGTLSAGAYLIEFKKNVIEKALIRNMATVDEFVDTVLLEENGVQIDIMRKTKASQDPITGIITSQLEVFASIQGAFITRESFDITESQISGRDVDFEYTTPIIFAP